MKENKAQYVKRERDLMSNLDHPFFVKLYFKMMRSCVSF